MAKSGSTEQDQWVSINSHYNLSIAGKRILYLSPMMDQVPGSKKP
ncbi:MAG: hypothetical protein RMJ44_06130 [Cytophagales bacterium]|nr:hypothetical protein [Bernardetiaceae bacterium]MDW8210647.1 hypothetical protein [Cytophagales bacterium]